MTDVPSTPKTLAELTVGIPGAGRRTLLAAMSALDELQFPEKLRICVMDATRIDAPAQLALLDELAADPSLEPLFVLNKADKISAPRTAVARTLNLLRERGFPKPRLWPVCAAAAKLFRRPAGDPDLLPKELKAQGDFYYRYGPGENSLSAFAFTGELTRPLGSREISPQQLQLALLNTGVPALEAKLRLLGSNIPTPEIKADDTPEIGAQSAEIPVGTGCAAQKPAPEAEPPASGERSQASAEDAEDEQNVPEAAAAPKAAEPDIPAPEGDEPEAAVPAAPEAVVPAAPDAAVPAEPEAEAAAAPETVEPEPPALVGEEPEAAAPAEPDPIEAKIDAFLDLLETPEEAPLPDQRSQEDGEKLSVDDEPLRAEETDGDEARESAELPEAADQCGSEQKAPEMPELLTLAERADCAMLLDLARRVPQLEASDEERERVLAVLHETYLSRQTEELDAMTRGADNLELPSLQSLVDRISAGPYTVQARSPYLKRLNRRLDELQSQALEKLCADVETVDSRGLARIRAELERADCAEILKSEHFRRIDARQEALDLEALDRVTNGAETMTEKELRATAVTLEASNWNPRYVNGYRHKINLCREAVRFREVDAELAELDDMERREILALRDRIAQKELPARFTVPALDRIDEKLFRLDMLRLLALNKDLDRLDFDGIDELRSSVARGDYCKRAKQHYLDFLLKRENALIMENTTARVELTRQLIARHKLHTGDFTLASAGEIYQAKLEDFWGGSGLEQPRDIPVFFFDNGSQYAMNAARFYFKVGRYLDCMPLENIEHFQVMRQHLSLFLQIVGKDNSYWLTEARINRSGSERTLAFLNDCVTRWNNPGPAGPLPASLRVRMEDAQVFTAPVEKAELRPQIAWELFCEAYQTAGRREGFLIRPEDEAAMQRVQKLLFNFGLGERTSVIWYLSASRLGSVKEGVALGPAAIYRKEGKQPVQVIPLEEIYEIRPAGSKRAVVTTLRNESVNLEIPDDMVPLIADYIHTIQLGAYLRQQKERT